MIGFPSSWHSHESKKVGLSYTFRFPWIDKIEIRHCTRLNKQANKQICGGGNNWEEYEISKISVNLANRLERVEYLGANHKGRPAHPRGVRVCGIRKFNFYPSVILLLYLDAGEKGGLKILVLTGRPLWMAPYLKMQNYLIKFFHECWLLSIIRHNLFVFCTFVTFSQNVCKQSSRNFTWIFVTTIVYAAN